MKKKAIICSVLVAIITITLGFSKSRAISPKTYYKIYLGEEYIGMVESIDSLNEYIDKKGLEIKEKYDIDKVLSPEELVSSKVVTYDNTLMSIEDIYDKLSEKTTFTINAYEYKITDGEDVTVVYTLNEDVFEKGIEKTIETFIGVDEYNSYKNKTQEEIITTGEVIDSIYVEGKITFRNINVPVSKKIYTNPDDLANFFLYSDEKDQTTYTVKAGDDIKSISYANEISEMEFLLSNSKFSNSSNLLYPGQLVSIVKLNPQIKIVYEKHIVSDIVKAYTVEEKYDDTKFKGDNEIVQKGENGLERVTQNIKVINGVTIDARNENKVELRPAVNQIVVKGDKIIPNVGSLYSWLWPTDSGYSLTSFFGYRIDPVYGGRAYHSGVDIAGLGYGANIYATNNGTVEQIAYSGSGYGNYVVINHNNGYYSLYGHMQRVSPTIHIGDTVSRGQILGYIGSTGKSTGPHLHFEIHKGCLYCRMDPLDLVK